MWYWSFHLIPYTDFSSSFSFYSSSKIYTAKKKAYKFTLKWSTSLQWRLHVCHASKCLLYVGPHRHLRWIYKMDEILQCAMQNIVIFKRYVWKTIVQNSELKISPRRLFFISIAIDVSYFLIISNVWNKIMCSLTPEVKGPMWKLLLFIITLQ